MAVPCLEFPGARGQIAKKPSLSKSSHEETRAGSPECVCFVTNRCVQQVYAVKLTGSFSVTVTGPGRTSPYLRASAKMKPIEESVEDDVFEAPSADKLELQRLP